MRKIVTVSPNVALDRVVVVRGFQPGQQSRALFGFTQPGGSGVHASLIIQELGGQTVALGLIGGLTGEMWRRDADARSLRYDMVPLQDDTRLSYCLVDLDQGSVVESVEAGPHVDETALSHLLQLLESHLADADLLVVSGSLPVGLPVDSYAQMIRMAHNYKVPTLADIYGDALRAAAQQTPWLIKPNLTEFQNLLGRYATSLEEHAEAARRLRGAVATNIALSMGQSGMLLTTPEGQWLLEAPDERMHLPDGPAINTIGCGDALVGALAQQYIESGDLLLGARMGIAAAHANLSTYGVPDVDPALVWQLADQVRVRPLSP